MKTIVFCLSLLSVALLTAAADPIDPCNKPGTCSSNIKIPDPEDCDKYYMCNAGSWTWTNCSVGTLFDNHTLNCVSAKDANCQPECPSFTGRPAEGVTQRPGTCEDVEKCVDNKKYAEKSSCRNYYLCTGGHLELKSCSYGKVFDVKTADCIDSFTGFKCVDPCTKPSSHPTSGSAMEQATAATVIGLSLLVLCLSRQ